MLIINPVKNTFTSLITVISSLSRFPQFSSSVHLRLTWFEPFGMTHTAQREWDLTGVLGEESAALAVDNLLDDWHVRGYRRGRDQTDARHHGVYWGDESEPGVEPLDTKRVCRQNDNR